MFLHTFNVGMGAMSHRDFRRRALYFHADGDARLIRLCLLAGISHFAVVFRPGECQVSVVPA